ncbi:hypothetical protein C8J57DRAFT_1565690 [Mycena rebaudengoi]|nr:hypothetical protein C8J57DRAFT_1565690 [Mycena rebaudengoi]
MKLSIPLFILATLFADAYAMPAGVNGTVATPVSSTALQNVSAIAIRGFAPRADDNTDYYAPFMLFAVPQTSVPREWLGDLLRAVGQNPTQSDVDNIVSAASPQVYYDEFERIVNRPDGFANAGTKKEVVTRACHAFDEAGHGTIGVVELRYVLKRLGEMSDAEVDELLKRVPPGTNSAVNIDSIIAAIFGQ